MAYLPWTQFHQQQPPSGYAGQFGPEYASNYEAPTNWNADWSSWFPWANWGETPWANWDLPKGDMAAGYQGWLNTFLPWIQAGMQGQQWGSEFDWTKEQDVWNRGFQQSQFDWAKAMDEWSKEQDLWARGVQEEQLKQAEEQANLEAFGRRWKPSTRWQ